MSQPEIFRRCAHCGASSKPGELFCAQCGNALVSEKSDQSAPQSSAASGTVLGPETAGAGDTEQLTTPNFQTVAPEVVVPAEPAQAMPPVTAPRGQNPANQQAELAARGATEDKVNPRAEKLRRVSSVVLNEAAYDPSVRFILVVGILFALFLVLLFLSKWIV